MKRAIAAVRRAHTDTASFDNGGMASHEIMCAIEDYLNAEFGQLEWQEAERRHKTEAAGQ